MSGPTAGGGGDLISNLFGGGSRQVYPPAPPGYKYVDLSIPQAPPGYTVAKMSMIANNQSTPAVLGGNTGLTGSGKGSRYQYEYGAHTPQGIAERAAETARLTGARKDLPASPPAVPPAAAPPASPPAKTSYLATPGSTTNQPLPGLPGSDSPPNNVDPTPQNLKAAFMPQALASFWQNMSSGLTPAFDSHYATVDDQKYDPLQGA